MPPYIITPWRAQTDLLSVRQQLYRLDGANDNRRYAVDRVMAWRLRGNLPHAVESTALLIDAFLHHDIASNSSFSVRAVYSAAFCRFVTGFCDIGRNRERSLEPSSMLEIARQIDMPADFVALRHEATHEELPSEKRIVSACDDALQWLWRVYWSRLDLPKAEATRNTSENERAESCKAFAQKMFRTYRSAKRDSLKQKKASAETLNATVAESANAFVDFCAHQTEALQVMADEVVDKGLLLPSDRKLGASLDGAFLMWDDLLLSMCQGEKHFINSLVQALLTVVNSEEQQYEDSQREAYTQWLSHICCAAEWRNMLGLQLDGVCQTVMKSCLMHPSSWTSALSEALLESGDEGFTESWRPFLEDADTGKYKRSDTMDVMHLHENGAASMETNHTGHVSGGWHRAVLPPVTPIGVVA